MNDTHVFRPSKWLRLWHTAIGLGLCVTGVMAPVGLWFLGMVLFKRVVVYPDRIQKGPLGGTLRFDEVVRWGRYHVSRKRDRDGDLQAAEDYVVLQTRSGQQMCLRLDDYAESPDLESRLHERLGHWVEGVQWAWFRGPRFPAPAPPPDQLPQA